MKMIETSHEKDTSYKNPQYQIWEICEVDIKVHYFPLSSLSKGQIRKKMNDYWIVKEK